MSGNFGRCGKLKLALCRAHYDTLARGLGRLRKELDADVELFSAIQVRNAQFDAP